MAQKAKCLTRKINHQRNKRATDRSSSYEKRKKEYKDKVWGGKCTGKSYPEIRIYRKWSMFSNISKFAFFRE